MLFWRSKTASNTRNCCSNASHFGVYKVNDDFYLSQVGVLKDVIFDNKRQMPGMMYIIAAIHLQLECNPASQTRVFDMDFQQLDGRFYSANRSIHLCHAPKKGS